MSQKLSKRPGVIEAPMAYRNHVIGTDRQLERVVKYHPDGSIEATRVRIREREQRLPYRLPAERPGCLLGLVQVFVAGLCFVVAFAAPVLIWGDDVPWWAPLASLAAFSAYVSLWLPGD